MKKKRKDYIGQDGDDYRVLNSVKSIEINNSFFWLMHYLFNKKEDAFEKGCIPQSEKKKGECKSFFVLLGK